MGIYVELNDICESMICCNDIISVGYARDSSNNIVSCLEVYYRTSESLIVYYYNNMDKAMNDLKRIKNAIGNVRKGITYFTNQKIITNEL